MQDTVPAEQAHANCHFQILFSVGYRGEASEARSLVSGQAFPQGSSPLGALSYFTTSASHVALGRDGQRYIPPYLFIKQLLN